MYDEWTLIANYGVLKFLIYSERKYRTRQLKCSKANTQKSSLHYLYKVYTFFFFHFFLLSTVLAFMNGQSPNCYFFINFFKFKNFFKNFNLIFLRLLKSIFCLKDFDPLSLCLNKHIHMKRRSVRSNKRERKKFIKKKST